MEYKYTLARFTKDSKFLGEINAAIQSAGLNLEDVFSYEPEIVSAKRDLLYSYYQQLTGSERVQIPVIGDVYQASPDRINQAFQHILEQARRNADNFVQRTNARHGSSSLEELLEAFEVAKIRSDTDKMEYLSERIGLKMDSLTSEEVDSMLSNQHKYVTIFTGLRTVGDWLNFTRDGKQKLLFEAHPIPGDSGITAYNLLQK